MSGTASDPASGPVPGITDRALGTTGLRVPALVLGTAGLGRKVDEPTAAEVLRAAAAAGWRTWDTSNEYGDAEARIGSALDGLADVQVLTKADPLPGSADFSGDRVRASVAESLERLRLDRLPLVHLHDPERISFDDAMARTAPSGRCSTCATPARSSTSASPAGRSASCGGTSAPASSRPW